MSFTFTNTTPAASEAPKQSQPKMLQNFQSTETILAVDHVTFNNATGGQHTKVTYVAPITPAAPTGDTSVGYSNIGDFQAAPTIPELYWRNSQAIFPISAIKAFGVFVSASTPVTDLRNSFNIASISGSGTSYVITLDAGVTNGNDVCVFLNVNNAAITGTWTFTAGVLNLTVPQPSRISFVILQI